MSLAFFFFLFFSILIADTVRPTHDSLMKNGNLASSPFCFRFSKFLLITENNQRNNIKNTLCFFLRVVYTERVILYANSDT